MAFGVRTAYHATDLGAIAAELRHPDWLNERWPPMLPAAVTTAPPENNIVATMPELPMYNLTGITGPGSVSHRAEPWPPND
jgi:hypothetical protein